MIQSLAAAVLTVLIVPPLIRLAWRFRLVDKPGGRKRHFGTVPLVGGLAIYAAMLAVGVFCSGISANRAIPFAVLAGGAVAAGLLDDKYELSPSAKLALQFAIAALAVFWGGHAIADLGNIIGLGALPLGPLGRIFSILLFVVLMNAINLIDGADGVAGGVAGVILVGLMALAATVGTAVSALAGIELGAILGFLVYNMPLPRRQRPGVFLGDAGSMLIGFTLAWFSLGLHQRAPLLPPIALAWILAVPVIDMGCVTVSRMLRGLSPFTAGRDHLHHLLLNRGMTGFSTALTVGGITAVFAGIGVAGAFFGVREDLLCAALVAAAIVYGCLTNALRRGAAVAARRRRVQELAVGWHDGVPDHSAKKDDKDSHRERAA